MRQAEPVNGQPTSVNLCSHCRFVILDAIWYNTNFQDSLSHPPLQNGNEPNVDKAYTTVQQSCFQTYRALIACLAALPNIKLRGAEKAF